MSGSSVGAGVQDVGIHYCAAWWTLFTGMGGGPRDIVPPNTTFTTTAPCYSTTPIPLTQDVQVQDPPKGLSELPNAISVDEGIHNRVSMGEDDGNVHHPDMWALTVLTKVVERVDDVQWKPTQSK